MTEQSDLEKTPTVEQPGDIDDKEQSVKNLSSDLTSSKSGPTSVWVNTEKMKAFRKMLKLQGGSLTDELNGFLDRRMNEMRGVVSVSEPNSIEALAGRRQGYEQAKKRLFELDMDVLKMVKFFRDQDAWTPYVNVICTYLDYHGKFEPPEASYGYGSRKDSGAYDDYFIRYVEEASDKEVDFRREITRFLVRNRSTKFVHEWVSFVEKLAEKRKLGNIILQYQMDQLSPEQLAQMQEEERQREERNRLKEEAKLKVDKENAEAREREEEQDWKEQEADTDDEEEESEDETTDDEEDEEEGFAVVTVPKEKEPCMAIVPVGEAY